MAITSAAARAALQGPEDVLIDLTDDAPHDDMQIIDLEQCSAQMVKREGPQASALDSSQDASCFDVEYSFLLRLLSECSAEEEGPSSECSAEQQADEIAQQMHTAHCSPDGAVQDQQHDEADQHERNAQRRRVDTAEHTIDLTGNDDMDIAHMHFCIERLRDSYDGLAASHHRFEQKHRQRGAVLRPPVYTSWLCLRRKSLIQRGRVLAKKYDGLRRTMRPKFFAKADSQIADMQQELGALFAELNAAAPHAEQSKGCSEDESGDPRTWATAKESTRHRC